MNATPDLDRLARTVGDATRIRMLVLLMEGRALTAKELAYGAGVEPATATSHLRRLEEDALLDCIAQGRHKYYRLTSPEVARMIESLMAVAPRAQASAAPPRDPLRVARFCYDHLAGELGTQLTHTLVDRSLLKAERDAFRVTRKGAAWFADFGIDLAALQSGRRKFAYGCLDWSERRHHLGGALGAALGERMTALGWIARRKHTRVVIITEPGKRALAKHFGIKLE